MAVLEAREASGGTWDLFKYPGIRSDSDMFTFGFGWRPWPGDRALADGPSILEYLRTVAEEYGVDELIRYRHQVTRASWDSETALWTVEVDHDGEPVTLTASFLWGCAGLLPLRRAVRAGVPGRRAASRARSSTRSTGPRTSTTRASGSWSSAAAPPR